MTQNAALATLPYLAMRPSPALIAATAMLALPSTELEQVIERTLEMNPALERVEQATCHLCGRRLVASQCFLCGRLGRIPPSRNASADTIAQCPVVPTLAETLLWEVGPLLGRGDRRIAVYLLGSLDSRGFLDATIEAAAAALRVEPRRVARVLRLIQETAPTGVAARDLRECLLIQLDRSPDRGPVPELARRVVADHLALLGEGSDGELARVLGVGRADVMAVREFIRNRLHPRPDLGVASVPAAPPLVPDIAVREAGNGFDVELIERDRFILTISPAYEQTEAARLSPGEREMIRRLLLAAHEFIGRLEQRWRTMGRVSEVAVARQREFVRHGASRLGPLTRAQVADALGVHESTVSRAVAGRNVLLPSGKIIPFAYFFGRSSAPQDALADLVATEEWPKSDIELAGELAALGFVIARRTVAKYRDQLGILPSTQRKPAKRASRSGLA
jgi:RNA polymerase sigma-54 factor